jgi:alpha-tubulin suppressor-like RCC1 family protein
MSLTRVTDNVVTPGTITPDKLSTGAPTWNSSGILSATGFIGDGSNLSVVGINRADSTIRNILSSNYIDSYITAEGFVGDGRQLSNVFPSISVVEITDNSFFLEPKHNNCIVILNSLSTIDIDIPSLIFTPGHQTIFIQYNLGRGKFTKTDIYNANNFYETRKQYAKCALANINLFQGWTLYGDLTSTVPSTVTPTTPVSSVSAIGGINLSQIDAGSNISMVLSGNVLFAAGDNSTGQLGLTSLGDTLYYTRVKISLSSIAAGQDHSIGLSGTDLYSVGANGYGQLGFDDTTERSTFTKVTIPANAKWTAVAAAYVTSLALSSTDLYACGYNISGGLGLNNTAHRYTFTKVTTPADAKWTAIAAGLEVSAALSGTDLYVTGRNDLGQLGLGNRVNRFTFTRVTSAQDGSTIILNPKWTAVAVNNSGFGMIALSGTDLYTVGWSQQGQLGLNISGDAARRSIFTKVVSAWDGSNIILNPKWTAITSGGFANYALSGTDLYACGMNFHGQLGLNNTINRSLFTKVPGNWNTVKAGWNHAIALSSNNTLFGSGRNLFGQLGLGFANNDGAPNAVLAFTQVTGVAIPQ